MSQQLRDVLAKRLFLADGKRPTLWPEYGEGSEFESVVRKDREKAYKLADEIIEDIKSFNQEATIP